MPPLPNEPWSTNYPANQDTGTDAADQQPTLSNDSTPGANDGHRALVEHVHALRNKLHAAALKVGDDSDLPSGSHGARLTTLEGAPAQVAVPGDSKSIIELIPGSPFSLTSGTFATVTGADTEAFVVPIKGDYVFEVYAQLLSTSGGSQIAFRVIVDQGDFGGFTAQTIAPSSDGLWSVTPVGSGVHEAGSFRTQKVSLEPGTHKVTIEYKVLSGSNSQINTDDYLVVHAMAVTGSGAAGVLVDKQTNAADVGSITTTPVVINTHSIDTLAGEEVLASANFPYTSTATGAQRLAYRIDAGSWVDFAQDGVTASDVAGLSGAVPITLASAGPHTIDIGIYAPVTGTVTVRGATDWPAESTIYQYRGGLVPIQDGGVDVLGMPRALNFLGPVGVVDTGGVADIEVQSFKAAAEAAVGPRALLASETGKLFTNEGATAEVGFTLPAAAVGLSYSFIVQDVDGLKVTAAAGDTIRIAASVSAGGGFISATAIGNAVHLVAINATEWIALSSQGSWTVT
jgi:hypothetical protein